jgi:sulfur carrier protein ThiS
MKLHPGGHLTFYIPGRKRVLEISLNKPTPLREILTQIGIPLSEVALTTLNGELADSESVIVNDTDQVRVFSAVNGG